MLYKQRCVRSFFFNQKIIIMLNVYIKFRNCLKEHILDFFQNQEKFILHITRPLSNVRVNKHYFLLSGANILQ